MQKIPFLLLFICLFIRIHAKDKSENLRKRKIAQDEAFMTDHLIEKAEVGVDFKAGPGIEFRKPVNKKTILHGVSDNSEQLNPFPTKLTYPSSAEINEYAKGTPLTADDLMTINPVTFVPFKISDEGAIGSVDVAPSKNLINPQNNEKLIKSEWQFRDFYKNYYQGYYNSLSKLYNGSNTTGISDPKMKKVYKYAPLMYSLNYENNILTNNKINLKFSPSLPEANPCPCDKNIETCNCDSLLENESVDSNRESFIPIWQPTIKHRDCQEPVENCSCDEEACSSNDINCLSKVKCQCGCSKNSNSNSTPKNSKQEISNSNATNSTNTTTNSTGQSTGFSSIKANANNYNGLSNSNNLNKIGSLKTSSYETRHTVQHVNNYFYGQNFKEISH